MQVGGVTFGIGSLIALLILVIYLILWVIGHAVTDTVFYAGICGLALARLVP